MMNKANIYRIFLIISAAGWNHLKCAEMDDDCEAS
jgi:hypothetical protein